MYKHTITHKRTHTLNDRWQFFLFCTVIHTQYITIIYYFFYYVAAISSFFFLSILSIQLDKSIKLFSFKKFHIRMVLDCWCADDVCMCFVFLIYCFLFRSWFPNFYVCVCSQLKNALHFFFYLIKFFFLRFWTNNLFFFSSLIFVWYFTSYNTSRCQRQKENCTTKINYNH